MRMDYYEKKNVCKVGRFSGNNCFVLNEYLEILFIFVVFEP